MFLRGANPIWSFVDLIGQQLDDSYYISFLSNTFPYLPQLVTHDNQGLVPWSEPIEFLANGTLPPDIYGDPDLVYRLEIRQGPLQSDPLIYLVTNYVFGDGSNDNTTNDNNQENQISNPQFAFVNFLDGPTNPATPNPQIIFTTAGVYEIAPGWSLVLVGTGSCTITQVITNGAQNIPNSPVPPYYLEFVTSGWTSVILEQTLLGNGAIWYNNYVAANILVKSNDSIAHLISVSYVPNTPGAPVPIISAAQMSIGTFENIQGVAQLFPPGNPVSINTTANNLAYVNIQITLPSSGTVDLSNIQLFGIQNTDQITVPVFGVQPEETIERQFDHLAHYFIPKVAFKPIPSWLVGWDFPLNPTQVYGSTVAGTAIGANKSKYVWDQTIIFQSTNSSVSVQRGDAKGIQLIPTLTTKMALIQYLQAPEANIMLANNLSVYMLARCNTATTTRGTISLWYTTDGGLPNINDGTNNSLVATLDVNGKPATFNGNWTEVPLKNLQEATFKLGGGFLEYKFPFWTALQAAGASASATYFAIVVGFSEIPGGTIDPQIVSIGLNTGDIATPPGAQSADEVLRQCQYYWETTYELPIVVNTVPGSNKTILGASVTVPYGLSKPFKVVKRFVPNIRWYSPIGGVIDSLYDETASAVVPVSGTVTPSTSAPGDPQTAGLTDTHALLVQWTADARLGIV